MNKYNINDVQRAAQEYFNGNLLTANTWINKYSLKDSEGNFYELTPTDMHTRLASELHRIELKYPNPLSQELIFSLIDHFKYIIPGGSPMAGIGNTFQVSSLSNCFTEDALVLTINGYKKISNIIIGDIVLTHTGRWKRVVNTLCRDYVGDMIIFNDRLLTHNICVTPEHQFYQPNNKWKSAEDITTLCLLREDNNSEYITVDLKSYINDLSEYNIDILECNNMLQLRTNYIGGKGANSHKDGVAINRFITVDEEFAYLLGRFIGDGSIFTDKYNGMCGFNITFNKSEQDALKYINQIIFRKLGISAKINGDLTKNNFNNLRISSYIWATFLYKEFGKNHDKKHLSKLIFNSNKNIKKYFLLGVIDADGLITKSGAIRLTMSNKKLIDDLQALFNCIGIPSTQNIFKTSSKYKNSYSIYINGNLSVDLRSISRKKYNDNRLSLRKSKKSNLSSNITEKFTSTRNTIKSVIKYSGQVYNISVEDDESYIVNNSICHNCFVIGNEIDSYGGIIRSDEEQVQLMKRRGGVGLDLSHIRPKGSPVKNSALTSTGVVPFMERYSNSTREVAQDGRRGALMISLSIKHPDAEDFIDAKLQQGKVTGANISIKITDDFMKCVLEDIPFTQQFPIDSDNPKITKQVDAKRIWDKIIHNAWKTAEPGILFWDTILTESPADCYAEYGFKTVSTNPCGEIPLCPYDSCRLLSLNLFSYVINPFTVHAKFDFDLFRQHVRYAQRMMDDLIDLEIEKIDAIIQKIESDPEPTEIKFVELNVWKKIKEKTEAGRRTGLGTTGEGDMLAALGLKYGTDAAIEFSVKVHKHLATNAYISSIIMAEERGSFKYWNYDKEKYNPFINRVIFDNDIFLQEAGDLNIIKMYKTTGRRNMSLLTIAPTGTTSLMTQTTSGIEPAFNIRYKRKRKINPNDKNVDQSKITFDQVGDAWEEYNVYHMKFIEWMQANGYGVDLSQMTDAQFEEIYSKSPYYQATSADVDWLSKVKMQGEVQKWIDHSISVTVNCPEHTTEDMISKIYLSAWKVGCKGITIYREGSREGVLISKPKESSITFIETDAPKRPKVLPCDIIRFMNKGVQWIGVLGILDGRPYELFTGKLEAFNIPQYVETGAIIRVKEEISTKDKKQSRYDFQYTDSDGYRVTMEGLNRAFDREYSNYGRLISGILRHGMPIQNVHDIVDQLKITDDGNDVMSWKTGVKRLIKKYIKDGTKTKELCPECGSIVIYTQGCKSCSSECGWTKCEL